MARAYDHSWATIRLSILQRDDHLCRLGLRGCTSIATHVDHIVPLAEGGARLDPSNLRASCESCNLRRSAGRTQALVDALQAAGESTPSRQW